MANHVAVLVPGDGIGPEVARAVERVLAEAGAPIEWERHAAGVAALDAGLDVLPDATVRAIAAHGVALKGPCTTPVGKGFTSVNVQLRKKLELYACGASDSEPRRGADAILGGRPRHRSREHRGSLQRDRERGQRRAWSRA